MPRFFRVPIVPMPAPRQNRSDRWKQRPCVMKYRAYRDEIRLKAKELKFVLPDDNFHLKFFMPMPKSWSKKRREVMVGEPHQQKPDLDNLTKAIWDSLKEKDETIWHFSAEKLWWYYGYVEIMIK